MSFREGQQWPGGNFLSLIPERSEQVGIPLKLIPFILIWVVFTVLLILFLFVKLFVPYPRPPTNTERSFQTLDESGTITEPAPLPSWYEALAKKLTKADAADPRTAEAKPVDLLKELDPAELFITLVVPAYNEEHRLTGMLEEAVNYLETEYGTTVKSSKDTTDTPNGSARSRKSKTPSAKPSLNGWEILLIDDGSTDATLKTCTTFMRNHILPSLPRRLSGPWTHHSDSGVKIPPGSIRMISLVENRGKGGAVVHGMRHARGHYVVFADADGASKFTDLGKLVSACREVEDDKGRGVAVGSRAHLVGSEAVVKRSRSRNFLMHSFHLLLRIMTPKQTARIKDTQCGFKLFSRPSLPWIVPYMHMEGWIFDVEMLMLAEWAEIPVVEVAVGWREVVGSKLNVVWDSWGMAWGLAVLRIAWAVGIYRAY